jgi:hypothetical protein
VYVAGPGGVLKLSGWGGEAPQGGQEVPAFMVPGAVPVLPG